MYTPRGTPREKWLDSLKPGDKVIFTWNKKEKVMQVRMVREEKIFLVDENNPKMDLAKGEVVWQDTGDAPFGERIDPIGGL